MMAILCIDVQTMKTLTEWKQDYKNNCTDQIATCRNYAAPYTSYVLNCSLSLQSMVDSLNSLIAIANSMETTLVFIQARHVHLFPFSANRVLQR